MWLVAVGLTILVTKVLVLFLLGIIIVHGLTRRGLGIRMTVVRVCGHSAYNVQQQKNYYANFHHFFCKINFFNFGFLCNVKTYHLQAAIKRLVVQSIQLF